MPESKHDRFRGVYWAAPDTAEHTALAGRPDLLLHAGYLLAGGEARPLDLFLPPDRQLHPASVGRVLAPEMGGQSFILGQ